MNDKIRRKSIFDKDQEMDMEEMESQMEIIGDPLNFMNNDNTIYFGFYDKTSNIFYKFEESKSKKFTINRKTRELEIKYLSNKHSHSRILLYNLLDNAPILIRESKPSYIFNDDNYDYDSENIIIHFSYSPIHRKKRERYNDPSFYLMENYNLENNLLCFNCPYKTIFIPKCSKYNLEQIYNQILYKDKREIFTDNEIKILLFDNYKNKVKELKERLIISLISMIYMLLMLIFLKH